MKHLSIFVLLLLLTAGLAAQEQKHVVFLKNKDNNPYSLSNPGAFLTQRSLDRRAKAGISLDFHDLPVTPSYVTQIAATGATVVYPLKWFNAVVINTNAPTVLAQIALLPFVDHIDQVLTDAPASGRPVSGSQDEGAIPPYTVGKAVPAATPKAGNVLNYGLAYNQAHMIAVDGLHNLGFMGQGMMIAVLDAGFANADQYAAFDSLRMKGRILGTRDFSVPGNNVFASTMHTHGTSVLSTMGANLPGEMVGTAPAASYWLIRTEVGDYEALIEEYNWAGGAEFADSLGADIINSSLGYTTFNNTIFDHTYADMDGNTTPVTRAADFAASRGILVVNSAGNDGSNSWHYIGAPADGDSVFTIGAVDDLGTYASFSSVGPTFDGRIKPDVMAQGQGTTIVTGSGLVGGGSGTSFSSPVTAGALACLWQSFPALSAEAIRNAVRNTASKASAPDNQYGWGIPDLIAARALLSTAGAGSLPERAFSLSPLPFASSPVLRFNDHKPGRVDVEILSVTGQVLQEREYDVSGQPSIRLTGFDPLPAGIYFVRITTGGSPQVIRAVKL